MKRPRKARIAVVGGGISGLSAAFRLRRLGYYVRVFERENQLGGRCAPGVLGEQPVMFGGKNIGLRYETFRELVRAFGDPSFEPFIISTALAVGDRLVSLDDPRGRLQAFGRMGSPLDLARLAHLAVRVRRDETNRFLGSEYFAKLAARRDDAPLAAHFGDRLGRTLLRSMTVRMNGAEPDETYLGTFGTNLGMLLDHFEQLRLGIGPVLSEFAEQIPVSVGAPVRALDIRDGNVAGIRLFGSEEPQTFDAVVLAVPAPAAAPLVGPSAPDLAERLREVRYFPAAVILAAYDRPVFTGQQRAIAFARGACSNAGSYGEESRHLLRYTFSGRDARDMLANGVDADELIAVGEGQLDRHVSLERLNRVHTAIRRWDAALCAYVPFHHEFLAAVRASLAQLPGLELAGDYLRGASMEACARSGAEAARRIDIQLRGAADSV